MKLSLFILTMLLAGLQSNAQARALRGNEHSLKGKVVTEIGRTFECGVTAWAGIIEFEIIDFSDSDYSNNIIPVFFECPGNFHRDLFKIGKTFNLVLVDENQADFEWTMTTSHEDILAKYDLKKKYWFVKTKKLN